MRKGKPLLAALVAALLAVLASGGSLRVLGQTGPDKGTTPGTVTAGNGIYNVHVQDSPGAGVGLYTATTGPGHPAGVGLNVLYGDGSPGTTFNTIRSYTTGTDYVQDSGKSSSNAVIFLDPFGSVAPLGATGFRTTYVLPGPPATPDALTITSDVKVNGTTAEDSSIEVTTTVTNSASTPVLIGIRYHWDFQIAADDGPTFQEINPSGAVRTHEAQFLAPAFESYRVQDNDVNASPPTFSVYGTVAGPAGVVPAPTAPDSLQYVCWPAANHTAFEYVVDPTRDIATTASNCRGFAGGDVAVHYFFGPDSATAATIAPSGTHTVSASLFVPRPRAVVVLPGWRSDCEPELEGLLRNLEQEFGAQWVDCYEYDSRKGVEDSARDLGRFITRFRQQLGLAPQDEVHLVGHSMGGLVARYYYEKKHTTTDGPIGSISMLGTPNEGVHAARLHEMICRAPLKLGFLACKLADFIGEAEFQVDLESQAVKDMDPGSDLLTALNADFHLPASPAYRAHAGRRSTFWGWLASGSTDNDCFVSVGSVDGPAAIFGPPRLFDYRTLTHGGGASWGGCNPPTLTDSAEVVSNLVATIRGNPGGGAAATPVGAQASGGPGVQAAMVTTAVDFVQASQSKTHEISVPAGLGNTAFVVYWLDAEIEPDLGFTLRRPDGSVVNPGEADVVEQVAVTGDGIFYVLTRGFVMSAPQGGDWQVTVEGLSVPAEGQAYLVALTPDSQVVLSADAANPALPQGQPQVVMATLFDGATAIPATSISAEVVTPAGSQENLVLRDDGTGGDEVAGDLTYSGTFSSTPACGGYSVLVTATGNSSEGTVTRQQMAFFEARVPGDAIRDPCNPDDDGDTFTDEYELNVLGSDPLDPNSPALAVGGMAERADQRETPREHDRTSGRVGWPSEAVAAGVAVLLGAGAWYVRKRRVR